MYAKCWSIKIFFKPCLLKHFAWQVCFWHHLATTTWPDKYPMIAYCDMSLWNQENFSFLVKHFIFIVNVKYFIWHFRFCSLIILLMTFKKLPWNKAGDAWIAYKSCQFFYDGTICKALRKVDASQYLVFQLGSWICFDVELGMMKYF